MLKIKKEYIGKKVHCSLLRQWFIIEEGNEKKYFSLGLDIFQKRQKPKLEKKKDDQNKKGRNFNNNSDGNGIDDNK